MYTVLCMPLIGVLSDNCLNIYHTATTDGNNDTINHVDDDNDEDDDDDDN